MKAKQVMTQNVATIRASATITDAVKLMRFKELRCLIVEPRIPGDAYGIITETDIASKVVACGKDPKKVPKKVPTRSRQGDDKVPTP